MDLQIVSAENFQEAENLGRFFSSTIKYDVSATLRDPAAKTVERPKTEWRWASRVIHLPSRKRPRLAGHERGSTEPELRMAMCPLDGWLHRCHQARKRPERDLHSARSHIKMEIWK